jgi:predicted PurR-regulated permease PerM
MNEPVLRPDPRGGKVRTRKGLFRPERDWLRTAALLVIAAILLFGTLRAAQAFAIPTVLALLAAIALEPVARRADRFGLPRTLSAAAIVVTGICALVGLIYYLVPTAEAWNYRLPEVMEKLEHIVRSLMRGFSKAFERTNETTGDDEEGDPIEQIASSGQSILTGIAVSVPALLGGLVYAAILTFFVLKERGLVARLAIRLGATTGQRLVLARSMRDIQERVSGYLLTITLINMGLGLTAALVFWLLELPSPLLWGLLVAALNFMPYIGPAIMAVLVLAVGLVSYDDPATALLPPLALIVLNTIEGQLITPMFVGQQMELPALAIFVAITFGAWLWGPAGAILATPVLIIGSAFVRRMWPPSRRHMRSG